jgi:hypothetical protein
MTKPPPKPRNTDRHKPGYMKIYMRAYRAKKKAERAIEINANKR